MASSCKIVISDRTFNEQKRTRNYRDTLFLKAVSQKKLQAL